MGCPRWAHVPFDVAVVLPACCKLSAELDTGEDTRLAAHTADELDDASHGAGHVDQIANLEVGAVGGHGAGRGGGLANEGVQAGLAGDCRRLGEREVR